MEYEVIQTNDYGALEVLAFGGGWYDYILRPGHPREEELWNAAVKLAGPFSVPSYPFRFDKNQINRGGNTMAVTFDVVIDAYIKTREELSALKKAYEAKESELKLLQEKREAWMMLQLTNSGQTSAKTPAGTCYFTTKESVTVGDWDTFMSYVLTTEQYELLERRAAKSAVLDIMGANRDQGLPPGLNYTALKGVNVRKG